MQVNDDSNKRQKTSGGGANQTQTTSLDFAFATIRAKKDRRTLILKALEGVQSTRAARNISGPSCPESECTVFLLSDMEDDRVLSTLDRRAQHFLAQAQLVGIIVSDNPQSTSVAESLANCGNGNGAIATVENISSSNNDVGTILEWVRHANPTHLQTGSRWHATDAPNGKLFQVPIGEGLTANIAHRGLTMACLTNLPFSRSTTEHKALSDEATLTVLGDDLAELEGTLSAQTRKLIQTPSKKNVNDIRALLSACTPFDPGNSTANIGDDKRFAEALKTVVDSRLISVAPVASWLVPGPAFGGGAVFAAPFAAAPFAAAAPPPPVPLMQPPAAAATSSRTAVKGHIPVRAHAPRQVSCAVAPGKDTLYAHQPPPRIRRHMAGGGGGGGRGMSGSTVPARARRRPQLTVGGGREMSGATHLPRSAAPFFVTKPDTYTSTHQERVAIARLLAQDDPTRLDIKLVVKNIKECVGNLLVTFRNSEGERGKIQDTLNEIQLQARRLHRDLFSLFIGHDRRPIPCGHGGSMNQFLHLPQSSGHTTPCVFTDGPHTLNNAPDHLRQLHDMLGRLFNLNKQTEIDVDKHTQFDLAVPRSQHHAYHPSQQVPRRAANSRASSAAAVLQRGLSLSQTSSSQSSGGGGGATRGASAHRAAMGTSSGGSGGGGAGAGDLNSPPHPSLPRAASVFSTNTGLATIGEQEQQGGGGGPKPG